MNRKVRNILYSPLNLFFHSLALLPFSVLYFLSDILCFVTHRIARYRLKIVKANIDASFPEKTERERKEIINKFYRHFTDTFMETIKLLHISDNEMRKHIRFENCERVKQLAEEGKSVAIYAAHYGNWEWLTSIVLWGEFPESVHFSQVYRPLRNKWFDEFYYNLRNRFNTHSIAKSNVLRTLLQYRREGVFVTGFISDQKPSHNDGDHSVMFLNQETPFITGTELIIKKLRAAVMFFDVTKVGRGKYVVRLRDIAEKAEECGEYEITDTFAKILEKKIKCQPEIWLWTHNRWRRPKHK